VPGKAQSRQRVSARRQRLSRMQSLAMQSLAATLLRLTEVRGPLCLASAADHVCGAARAHAKVDRLPKVICYYRFRLRLRHGQSKPCLAHVLP
jgi:hypothetical protein